MSAAGTVSIRVGPMSARAPGFPPALGDVVVRSYGRHLEDFVPGAVFLHPRGRTIDRGLMLAFATAFHEANPLYLNEPFARSQGHPSLPASPALVMNLALSLGVQNDSEKAIANLGYYDVRFLRGVYEGDTLTARTRVAARRDRGPGKPGIATIETLALNDRSEVVVQYARKVMVPRRGDAPIDPEERAAPSQPDFPLDPAPSLEVPRPAAPSPAPALTARETLLDAFVPGRVFVHEHGRTVTDEHIPWTYAVMNTHPLHVDRLYSTARSGPMSGEPIVYGGLVFAWILGLASRDVSENGLWELGWHDGYHLEPLTSGETLAALTRVLEVEPGFAPDLDAGRVRLQHVGVKELRARDALDRYGPALFLREGDKRDRGEEKIREKVFEIERDVLVRRSLP